MEKRKGVNEIERLTFSKKFEETHNLGDLKYINPKFFYDMFRKLQDYEDSGLSPEEVSGLAQYRDLKTEGRLVVLPCKSKYGNYNLDAAIRRASYICGVTNNDQNRLTLDALIEKQIREEAALEGAEK